jgi:ADP-dependent NAD(P)H-hydrate dehydratase / NAD(P)H-hydrate epimerase
MKMNERVPALTQKKVMASFPKRPRDSHKGLFGTVAVIGGANGMIGAPLLAGRAALKLGAGCVHVGLLAENAPVVDAVQPELMLHPAQEIFSPPFALSLSKGKQAAIAIGCGLGTSIAAQKLLYEALMRDTALVIDADALNLLARQPDLQDDLRIRQTASVLTPHPGEAARLLGCDIKEIQADRVATVRKLAQKFACSVVLKGADSLCATRDGKLFVNKTGNPGMSSAGMGDVLSGMIAAFIAQGMTADNAMLLAVHLHGAAGDALAEQGITVGMTASDVTEWARWLLNQWLHD